jgi:hypothetical protein
MHIARFGGYFIGAIDSVNFVLDVRILKSGELGDVCRAVRVRAVFPDDAIFIGNISSGTERVLEDADLIQLAGMGMTGGGCTDGAEARREDGIQNGFFCQANHFRAPNR